MPCNDGGFGRDTGFSQYTLDNAVKKARAELEPLLCSACKALEEREFDFDMNPALADWWADHKKADAERLAAEQKTAWEKRIVTEALAKKIADLTPEEKVLLKKHKYL